MKSEDIKQTKVLFVCMGNICRSPTADAVFRHQVKKAGLDQQIMVDSAGTHAYHIG
ncbi:MAG: low molecular weight phosphotyrosine protein phosphatase, partial [Pseudomonadota bacterium]